MAMTVLAEMTKVMLAMPGVNASADEVAAWYELKAHLLEHIAAEGGQDTEEVRRQAELAHRRSTQLRGQTATVRSITDAGRRHRPVRSDQPGGMSRALRGRTRPPDAA